MPLNVKYKWMNKIKFNYWRKKEAEGEELDELLFFKERKEEKINKVKSKNK